MLNMLVFCLPYVGWIALFSAIGSLITMNQLLFVMIKKLYKPGWFEITKTFGTPIFWGALAIAVFQIDTIINMPKGIS